MAKTLRKDGALGVLYPINQEAKEQIWVLVDRIQDLDKQRPDLLKSFGITNLLAEMKVMTKGINSENAIGTSSLSEVGISLLFFFIGVDSTYHSGNLPETEDYVKWRKSFMSSYAEDHIPQEWLDVALSLFQNKVYRQ
jgi:hypothetical protein